MRPYVYEVFDQAREIANDNDRTRGGRTYHNEMLRPHLAQAYREYFRYAGRWKVPMAEGRAFFNLPAFTSIVEPLEYGINNFNAPIKVESRPAQTEVTGVSFTLGTPVSASKTGHGLSNGQQIIVSGLPATSEVVDLNNVWRVTVSDANTFTLNGSRFRNSTSTVTGTFTTSSGQFTPVARVDRVADIGDAVTALSAYSYTRGRLHFAASNTAHQLQVFYEINGDPPTLLHQEIPIDDSIDYLAHRTISLAMQAQGDPRAERVVVEAMGPQWLSNGIIGGQLGDLLHAQARSTHAIYRRKAPYRPSRNHPESYI